MRISRGSGRGGGGEERGFWLAARLVGKSGAKTLGPGSAAGTTDMEGRGVLDEDYRQSANLAAEDSGA